MADSPPLVVVITGASAGVGRCTAREFARNGARIGLLARGVDGLEAARQECEALGGRAIAIPTDVADPEQVESAAAQIEAVFGTIDVWVNNAMVSVASPVAQMTAAEYRRVTEVTYLGVVHGTLTALHRMRARNHGVIIQVGSALAYRAIPLQSACCAAKHAIKGFTQALRCELLHDGVNVRVTMVHLPALNTPQFGWVRSRLANAPQPVPPIFQPEVAARAIVWAADNDRREVWVGWPTVKAILGERSVPGLLDHYLAQKGYRSQQMDRSAAANRADNLWEPLPGDAGGHGSFDARLHKRSAEFWFGTYKRGLVTAVVVVAGVVGWLATVAL
jgi:NAD(P)-dependent dehydrogenase (short-subunit alcohol dehydrogenase family)